MKRFLTINVLLGSKLVDYEEEPYEVGEYIVDKSHFVPVSEMVSALVNHGASVEAHYDFQDGKDSGIAVPISRKKGVDIAELSQDIRKEQAAIQDKIEKAQKHAEYEAIMKKSSSSGESASGNPASE